MTRNTKSRPGLPQSLAAHIRELGQNIRLARKKRGLTMEDMASRMFVTRKTLKRLEDGESTVSLGVVASALLVLGLDKDLEKLADPATDNVGNMLDKEKYGKTQRVRSKKAVDMDF